MDSAVSAPARIKTIYLTIDDGPSADMTAKVEYLAACSMPAVFFCVGEQLEKRPDHAIRAIQRGFVIGNHSTTHPRFSETPLEECCREIAATDRIIDGLYRTAETVRAVKWFRFPFGDKGDLKRGLVFSAKPPDRSRKDYLQSFLRELGYDQPAFPGVTYPFYHEAELLDDVDWHWTYDVMEYATFQPRSILHPRSLFGPRTLSDVLARMDERRPSDSRGRLPRRPRWLGEPGSDEIVLIHDHDETAALFAPIVERLRTKPIRFGAAA